MAALKLEDANTICFAADLRAVRENRRPPSEHSGSGTIKKKDDMTSCLLSIRLNHCFPAASASFIRLSITLSADSLATRFIESLINHRLNLLQGAVCLICKTE